MLLVHSKSVFVSSQEKTCPFRFALYSEYKIPVFIALSQRWGNVERPFLWQVVLYFLRILFRFHIFFCNWKWEMSSITRCIFFFFFYWTHKSWHSLCLLALALTDQSLIGGKCGSAAECRLNSIIKSFRDEKKHSNPQDGFPSLCRAFEEIRTKSSTVTTAFKECIC